MAEVLRPGVYGPLACGCVLQLHVWASGGPLVSVLDGNPDCPRGSIHAEHPHAVDEFEAWHSGAPGPQLDTRVWPILAKLDGCVHFETFAVADSPHLGKMVLCHECGVERPILAAVDVAALVEIVDREVIARPRR